MDNYLNLLEDAAAGLTAGCDPDGLTARRALLLALYVGAAAAEHSTGPAVADWDLCTVAIADAAQALQADLVDAVPAVDEPPAPGPDSARLRSAVTTLVRRLADLYAAAAAGDAGTAWRRLVWAQVAHRLDDAAAELA